MDIRNGSFMVDITKSLQFSRVKAGSATTVHEANTGLTLSSSGCEIEEIFGFCFLARVNEPIIQTKRTAILYSCHVTMLREN